MAEAQVNEGSSEVNGEVGGSVGGSEDTSERVWGHGNTPGERVFRSLVQARLALAHGEDDAIWVMVESMAQMVAEEGEGRKALKTYFGLAPNSPNAGLGERVATVMATQFVASASEGSESKVEGEGEGSEGVEKEGEKNNELTAMDLVAEMEHLREDVESFAGELRDAILDEVKKEIAEAWLTLRSEIGKKEKEETEERKGKKEKGKGKGKGKGKDKGKEPVSSESEEEDEPGDYSSGSSSSSDSTSSSDDESTSSEGSGGESLPEKKRKGKGKREETGMGREESKVDENVGAVGGRRKPTQMAQKEEEVDGGKIEGRAQGIEGNVACAAGRPDQQMEEEASAGTHCVAERSGADAGSGESGAQDQGRSG